MVFFLVYLMYFNKYTVPCCGFITRWTAFIEGSPGDLYLQVWRLKTDTSWTLVGQNKVSVNSKQVL